MIVFRTCGFSHSDDISGESAKNQHENRWNSFGVPMLYTSESAALCALEIHEHLPPNCIPDNYRLLEIEIPDDELLYVDDDFFEDQDWVDDIATTQAIGNYFIKNTEFLIMKVPSAWVFSCWNYLINPNHKDFNKVKIIKNTLFPIEGKLFSKK